jgi:hypothetical protein
MMMSGPLRAAWQMFDSQRKEIPWRALLSLFIVVGVFTFFTQFSNAFSHPQVFVGRAPAGDTYFWDVALISYVLIPTLILMSAIIMVVLRWTLPFGSLTLLLAGNSILMFLMTWRYSHQQWPVLISAFLSGLLADLLMLRLKPKAQDIKALRWFSFLVPAEFFLAYFLTLILTFGIWWNSNLWLGMIFFSGILGLALSWLAVPPYSFNEDADRNLSEEAA